MLDQLGLILELVAGLRCLLGTDTTDSARGRFDVIAVADLEILDRPLVLLGNEGTYEEVRERQVVEN
jgi:hypothetical protein